MNPRFVAVGVIMLLGLAVGAFYTLPTSSTATDGNDRSFTLTIASGALTSPNSLITVTQGQTVSLTIDSDTDGTFEITDYNISANAVAGAPLSIGFIANKAGSYAFTFDGSELGKLVVAQ